MSQMRDMLRRRIAGDARPEIRVKIHLDPLGAARLSELEAELAELRDAMEDGAPVKMGGRAATLAAEIEELEEHLADSVACVVLRTLNSAQSAQAAAGLTEDDPINLLWRRNLRAAYVRCETLDRVLVEDVTSQDWEDLVEVMSSTEVKTLHERLRSAELSALPS